MSSDRRLVITDTYCVDYFKSKSNASSNLVVFTFTSLFNKNKDGLGFGGKFLLDSGYDVVAFKSSADDWFQTVTLDELSVVDYEVSKSNYAKRISYGSSLGGTAAIVFSRRLGINCCISISPQFEIDNPCDKRWAQYYNPSVWKYRISSDVFSQSCEYHIVYDPYDQDLWHFNSIVAVCGAQITGIKVPFSGHPSSVYLQQLDVLKFLFACLVTGNDTEIKRIRVGKTRSVEYLSNLARYLMGRGRYSISMLLIQRVLQLSPSVASYWALKSIIADKLSDWAVCYDSASEAYKLDSMNPHIVARLSVAEFKIGNLNDSIARINEAIASNKYITGFYEHKINVCRALGRVDEALLVAAEADQLGLSSVFLLKTLNHVR